jgi:drug/metabolite transporter (DMT)-like permease
MDGETTIAAPVLDYAAPPARRSATLAAVMLVLCCALWGYSFPVMQLATAAFERHMLGAEQGGHGPGTGSTLAARAAFNGLRFGLAAMLYAAFTSHRQSGFNRHEVIGGVWIGGFFAAGMLLQVTGLRWTLPSVSGFLTALAVVFAPLAQGFVLRRRVGPITWAAVALAVVGMMLLSWPKPEAHTSGTLAVRPPVLLLGETFTVLASLLFTVQILCLDHFGQKANATRLTLVVLGTTSILSFIGAAALDAGQAYRLSAWAGILKDRTIWWAMGTLVVFSSVLALHLMNRWQPLVSPATASVIYCSEPPFATLFSLMLGTERLTLLTVLGGAAVVGSVLIVSRFVPSPQRDPAL